MADVWPIVHAERKALADDLAGLSAEQWSTRSLCNQWTVHDCLAHMTSTAKVTKGGFVLGMVSSGFRFNNMLQKGIDAEKAGGPESTLAEFRAHINDTTSPPGPGTSWIGEAIVHAQDIRGPLGIAHTYSEDGLRQLADFYTKSNALIGGKKRVEGLRLRATDADWSLGDGPEVAGPMLALVQTITGRKAGIDELSGDGVETLRQRVGGGK